MNLPKCLFEKEGLHANLMMVFGFVLFLPLQKGG